MLLAAAVFCSAGCVAPLGPGYAVEKQEIRVDFVPAPEPHIRVEADYQLRNTGNRQLEALEVRLPGRRRFHYADAGATWDGAAISEETSAANPRETELKVPQPWTVSSSHMLRLSVEFQPPAAGESALSFAADAFFLPAEGWSPELLPARGLLGEGGVPPKKWELQVRVPQEFLVHMSGGKIKTARNGGELTVRAEQTPHDHYPFVLAGRYNETRTGTDKVYLWTRTAQEADALKQSSDKLARVLQVYDDAFGNRGKDEHALWIVECPVAAGCFSQGLNARLLESEEEPTTAELISQDSVTVDLSAGTQRVAAAVAPSLAASWLGYGKNPGFYEQDPPLSALPAFAAAVGREAVEGPSVRTATIRRLLERIPREQEKGKKDSADALRAKSLLFFYALQDRYGHEIFSKAIREMLDARRERGFELDDLIAAFSDESHENTAEFVRLWMKHSGVPGDFRARYEIASAAATHLPEERKP